MRNRTHRGYTLVETLMMVLVMAVGMAVTIPVFIVAMKDARAKQCRANMQAIANAEEQYKIKAVPHVYTTTLANLVGDFPVVPVCPNGGTYSATISNGASVSQSGQTIPSGGLLISCSVAADGKFAPTIDSQ